MTQIVNLFWFKKKGRFGNFGDELGPYIIHKLSGNEISHVPIPRTSIKLILAYLKGLFTGIYKLDILNDVLKSLKLNGDYIISVGSIIDWGSGKRIVWGSGILFSRSKVDNGKFLAVRGHKTRDRLLELGYDCPEIFGDPALLLPLVYSPRPATDKKHKLGLIPHHTQFCHFKKYEEKHDIKVINLIGDIEFIINEICSCERIISSSLHGLIVPHSYGIPALWYEYPLIEFRGEKVKYFDYFSSVGITDYKPFQLQEIDDFDIIKELENFEEFKSVSSINSQLSVIQKQLIDVAPFPVMKAFL